MPTAAEAARRRQEEEDASICLDHLLIIGTGSIQAGDESVAHDNLSEVRVILKEIPTSTESGHVGNHFLCARAMPLPGVLTRMWHCLLCPPATPSIHTTISIMSRGPTPKVCLLHGEPGHPQHVSGLQTHACHRVSS